MSVRFVPRGSFNGNNYIRSGTNYTPPAGYQPAGPRMHSGGEFRSYLEGVSRGYYHAGYNNWLSGHGVVKPR